MEAHALRVLCTRCVVSRETLPQDVMNGVMDLHHKLMRKLLVQHGGYESDTEGDSFIVAFATPWDALAFAQVRQTRAQLEGGTRALDVRKRVRVSTQLCWRVRPAVSSKLAKPRTIRCTRSTAHRARNVPGTQDVQRGLITLPWPDELLQCEEARPLVAQVGGERLAYGGSPVLAGLHPRHTAGLPPFLALHGTHDTVSWCCSPRMN